MVGTGTCECGCGAPTTISLRNDPRRGDVKGQPRRFVRGHANVLRRRTDRWHEEDRGHDTPCWVWLLATNGSGYGIQHVDGRTVLAHRDLYESLRGPVPPGLELDHLCRVRACVNPDHLEPVPAVVNVRRGAVPKIDAALAATIRVCAGAGEPRAEIARRYGLGWTTVDHIVKQRTWQAAA